MVGRELGSTTLLRSLWQGRVRGAYPTYRIVGEDAVAALYKPEGTEYIRSAPSGGDHVQEKLDGSWDVVHRSTDFKSLVLAEPGAWCSVWLLWSLDWEFGGAYVNFEEPWRETALGYDTSDLAVDIWVMPDGTWRWKDRDEFDSLRRAGAISPSAADAVLQAAEGVIPDIEAGRGLFDTALRQWRPAEDPAEPPPLPDRWAEV